MSVKQSIVLIIFAICFVSVELAIDSPFYKLQPWPRHLDDGYSQPAKPSTGKKLSVYNGLTATPGQFAWQVLLRIELADGSLFRCGGSIIALNFILTAAHCVCDSTQDTSDVSVLAGEYDLSASTPATRSPSRVLINAKQWVCHESYVNTDTELLNDVAVVQLPLFLRLSKNVTIVPMNLANVDIFYVGKVAQSSGWGMTGDSDATGPTKLQYYNPIIISSATCAKTFTFVNSSIVCVVTPNTTNIQSICGGDSGGPLVYAKTLIGVVSFGATSCEVDSPQGFSAVRVFFSWILKKMVQGNIGGTY